MGLPEKTRLLFFQTSAGGEPVRKWLRSLDSESCHAIGLDLMRVQWRWPIGMPLCRPMGAGLWEVRTSLSGGRIARVLFCGHEGEIVALHGLSRRHGRHLRVT